MGLLRKAAGTAARDDDARPIDSPPEKKTPATGGLLRRTTQFRASPRPTRRDNAPAAVESPPALSVEEIPVLEVKEVRPAVEIVRDLEAAVGKLQNGVELPSRLFTAAAGILGIRKGALLLYDPLRLVYAPWASLGYDQTTLHRMRIPLGANDSFNALANGTPLSLSDAALLGAYQPYFSTREFSSLGRILLTPFIAADTLIGVFLVTELALPDLEEKEILECLAALAATGAPRIAGARAKKLAGSDASRRPEPASLEEEATRFVRALPPGEQRAVFLSLSLESFVGRVLAGHQHLDPFRLQEDVQHFLSTFVADVGIALPVRPGIYIVGIQSPAPGELDLFLHQLGQFLHGLFDGNGGPRGESAPRMLKTRLWPEDGDSIRSLIDFLSS